MLKRIIALAAPLAASVALSLGAGTAHATTFSCSVRDFSGMAPTVTAHTITIPAAETTCSEKYMMTFNLQVFNTFTGTWQAADGSGGSGGGYGWCANASGVHDNPEPTSQGCQTISNEFAASSHHVVSASASDSPTTDPQITFEIAGSDLRCDSWRAANLTGWHINSDGSEVKSNSTGVSVVFNATC